MKISITHYDRTFIAEIPDESNIYEVADVLRGVLLICGFGNKTIDAVIKKDED